MPVILFVEDDINARANFLAQQLQSCLSFSTRNKIDYEILSQYHPNEILKYDLSEKGY